MTSTTSGFTFLSKYTLQAPLLDLLWSLMASVAIATLLWAMVAAGGVVNIRAGNEEEWSFPAGLSPAALKRSQAIGLTRPMIGMCSGVDMADAHQPLSSRWKPPWPAETFVSLYFGARWRLLEASGGLLWLTFDIFDCRNVLWQLVCIVVRWCGKRPDLLRQLFGRYWAK